MLTCRDLTYLVSLKRERGLSLRERAGVAVHLAFCRGCRQFTRQMRLLRAALARSEYVLAEQHDIRLSVGGRQRIRAALDTIDR